jgi:hypothetical protein
MAPNQMEQSFIMVSQSGRLSKCAMSMAYDQALALHTFDFDISGICPCVADRSKGRNTKGFQQHVS